MLKKLILFFTAVLFFAANGNAQTLVLYTTLDDAGSITSPDTGPAGSQNGGSFAAAQYDNGFLADDDNEYVDFDIGASSGFESGKLNETTGSILFWFKPSYSGKGDAGISKFIFSLGYSDFSLFFDNFHERITFRIQNNDRTVFTPTWSSGDLVHIAIVWDATGSNPDIDGGKSVAMYLNGSVTDWNTSTWTPGALNATDFRIGADADGSPTQEARGAIDDFYVYDDVLTSTQINSLKDSQVLPVELSSFSAELVNNSVEINWETKTEVNNYGFEIEQTLDHLDWETIGFVQGNGTTNSPKSYSFTDTDLPNAEKVHYRLKQIDNDGTFAYSKIVTVDLSTITSVEDEEIPTDYSLSQNYPNPFNPTTTIKFGLPESGFVDLRVYDILGQEVSRLVNEQMQAGYHEVDFGNMSLASGMYTYRIKVGNKFNSIKKMLLVK